MAAPNPLVRISPSGPILAGDSPPLDAILAEYAGYTYITNGPVGSYVSAKIGPANAPADVSGVCFISLINGPADIQAASKNGSAQFRPLNGDMDTFNGFTVGSWLVEANLTLGFNTSAAHLGAFGTLTANALAVNNSNVTVASGSTQVPSVIPRAIQGATPGAQADGLAHSLTMKMVVVITEALIEANAGLPIPGMSLVLIRGDSSNGAVGNITNDSGYLEFGSDTKVTIKRYRS
jgi:hypothetical protein